MQNFKPAKMHKLMAKSSIQLIYFLIHLKKRQKTVCLTTFLLKFRKTKEKFHEIFFQFRNNRYI